MLSQLSKVNCTWSGGPKYSNKKYLRMISLLSNPTKKLQFRKSHIVASNIYSKYQWSWFIESMYIVHTRLGLQKSIYVVVDGEMQ